MLVPCGQLGGGAGGGPSLGHSVGEGPWGWGLVPLRWTCAGSEVALGGSRIRCPPAWRTRCAPPAWTPSPSPSRVALSRGLPVVEPAPLWMCKHGNLGHLTCCLAQHRDLRLLRPSLPWGIQVSKWGPLACFRRGSQQP